MMFGVLADRFGWTPDQVGDMTLDQVEGYLHYIKEHPPFRL